MNLIPIVAEVALAFVILMAGKSNWSKVTVWTLKNTSVVGEVLYEIPPVIP